VITIWLLISPAEHQTAGVRSVVRVRRDFLTRYQHVLDACFADAALEHPHLNSFSPSIAAGPPAVILP
jgi:hypothetical protein